MTPEEPDQTYPFWIAASNADDAPGRIGLVESYLENLESDLVGLELGEAGSHIKTGNTFGFLHTASGTHDLRAPCAFEIIRLNLDALENAGIVRESPYRKGWLLEIRIETG
jgi:glycine cleavage system H protein